VLVTTTPALQSRIDAARAIDRHACWIFRSALSLVAVAIYSR
jgi:hypothetical protein